MEELDGKQVEEATAECALRVWVEWLKELGKAALLECIEKGMVPGDVVIIFKPNRQSCTLQQIAPRNASLGAYCGYVTRHSALYIYRELDPILVIRFQYHPDSNTVTVTDTWTAEQLKFDPTPRSRKKIRRAEKKLLVCLPKVKSKPATPYCLMIVDASGSIWFSCWYYSSSRNSYLGSVGVLTRGPIPLANMDSASLVSTSTAIFPPLTFAGEGQVRGLFLIANDFNVHADYP
jgi:hypothetical protein